MSDIPMDDVALRLLKTGMPVTKIASTLNIHPSTVYRWKAKHQVVSDSFPVVSRRKITKPVKATAWEESRNQALACSEVLDAAQAVASIQTSSKRKTVSQMEATSKAKKSKYFEATMWEDSSSQAFASSDISAQTVVMRKTASKFQAVTKTSQVKKVKAVKATKWEAATEAFASSDMMATTAVARKKTISKTMKATSGAVVSKSSVDSGVMCIGEATACMASSSFNYNSNTISVLKPTKTKVKKIVNLNFSPFL